jgi:hypothetical protein
MKPIGRVGTYVVYAGPGGVHIPMDVTSSESDRLDSLQARALAALIVVGAEEIERARAAEEERRRRR